MPLKVKINVALIEQNCQKIGSERVKDTRLNDIKSTGRQLKIVLLISRKEII